VLCPQRNLWTSNRTSQTIAIFAAVAWFLVDQASGHTYTSAITGYWNGGVVLAAYLAIAGAASSLRRKTIELERLKAELSAATARIEQLQRALPVHSLCGQ